MQQFACHEAGSNPLPAAHKFTQLPKSVRETAKVLQSHTPIIPALFTSNHLSCREKRLLVSIGFNLQCALSPEPLL